MKKIIGSLLVAGALLLTACGTTQKSATDNQAKEIKQEISVVSAGELSTLDSALYSDVNSSDMIG